MEWSEIIALTVKRVALEQRCSEHSVMRAVADKLTEMSLANMNIGGTLEQQAQQFFERTNSKIETIKFVRTFDGFPGGLLEAKRWCETTVKGW